MAQASQTPEAKGRKGAVIITLIVVALAAAGIFWYMQANNSSQDTTHNTKQLAENLKGIDAQDKHYANTKTIHLQPSSEVEAHYEVLRPLEQVKAGNSQAEQPNGSTLTAKEAYALGKNGDDGKTQYNASFFTYELSGDIASKSTDQIIKSQLDAAIAQAKQTQQANSGTVTVGQPEKSGDILFKTDKDETVQLASSKFEQTITMTSGDTTTQKKLVSLVAAAKFGNQLLFVNATFAREADFAKVAKHLQEMANQITLQLSE
ncbi:MAG TPA: hypothetical protein VFZ58_03450 [Candidatus Saccharimonadales bacterium]